MKPANPTGTINRLRAEAARLPEPCSEGAWMRVNGQRFITVAGDDGEGRKLLAWEALDPPPLYFRPTPVTALIP